jgi:hypothetical protein
MRTFEQSYSHLSPRAKKYHPSALLIVAVLGTLTVATPFPYVFSVPRPFLVAVLFTGYMFLSLSGKIALRYSQFAFAYLFAFIPASLFNFNDVILKWSSVLQMLVMLVTFAVLGSYFERWLSRNSDHVKVRWLEMLLVYFFVMSVLELLFNGQFRTIHQIMYPSQSDLYSMLDTQREMSIYGGRPTVFFSEPSNFAKFLSIIVATYMTATKCSKKSIFVLVVFYLLVRSVSYFYAAPLMLLAFWRLSPMRHGPRRPRRGAAGTKLFLAGAVAVFLLIGVVLTQGQRITDALAGQDNSLSGRNALPIQYMVQNIGRLIWGYGLTPQEEITNFTVLSHAMSAGNLDSLTPMMAATSTTITFIVGVGLAGLIVFFVALFLMQRGEGIWIGITFLVSNIINSGYNSSTTFVLSSLLTCVLVYQFSLVREHKKAVQVASAGVLKERLSVAT